jgi:hypothetical protein
MLKKVQSELDIPKQVLIGLHFEPHLCELIACKKN